MTRLSYVSPPQPLARTSRRGWLWLGLVSLALSGCGIPESKRPQSSGGAVVQSSPSAKQCHGILKRANVRFTPLPNRTFGGGCSQIDAITLLDLGTADVTNLGPIRCELAQKFAAWTEFAVSRAARQYLGSELVRIETMGSYSCRRVAGSGRLSEHGRANAIDVSGFVLADGRRITVRENWRNGRREKAFLRAIHKSACRRFGTVLSPDYNAAHHDHFHFDMGGNGFCR